MTGFELDTDEVGAMARTLHTLPNAPVTTSLVPTSVFPDLAAAGTALGHAWGTGVVAMSDDVTRLAESAEQAVLAYLVADERAAEAFGH